MREYSGPTPITIEDDDNLARTVDRHAREHPDRVLFRRPVDGAWQDVTASAFREEVRGLAKGLVASGVGPGDRVAIVSTTAYEWTLCDYAILTAGAVTVPVYETSSQSQVEWILGDSGTTVVLAQTPELATTVRAAARDLPGVGDVWTFSEGGLRDLAAKGTDVADDEIDRRVEGVTADAVATLVYTSGTTGRPKGCRLTHRNLLSNARNAASGLTAVFDAEGSSTLLFLPLAHVFARIIQAACFEDGVTLGHCGDLKRLLPELAGFRPSFILAVPRVFEKVYNGAVAKATIDGKGAIFGRAVDVAQEWSRSLDAGGPSLKLRAQHALFGKLVYAKLRDVMGGRVTYAISGGGPLAVELAHFFRGIGIVVLEGYGLTETSPVVSVNVPDTVRIGSVGRPIPGTEVRIADDGEILVRGPLVFDGYWNNEDATRDMHTSDGWLVTGDLGELDDGGFLKITGRKKEIIVTAGGKNVSPAPLEDRIRMHPLVGQVLVVGDRKPYVAALVTLDPEALPDWLKANGLGQLSQEEAAADETVRAAVQEAVDDANGTVSHAEGIKRFRLLATDWTIEGGELTAKQSMRRQVIMERVADDLEAVYAD